MNAKRTTLEELQHELIQGVIENEYIIINGTVSKFDIDLEKALEKALKVIW